MIQIKAFFHTESSTISYVVFNDVDNEAVIIDSVLDFDLASGKTSTVLADQQLAFVEKRKLSVQYIFETHAHADHLTAAHYLREKSGAKIAVSENVVAIQKTFSTFFNMNETYLKCDGREFDCLLKDGQQLPFSDQTIGIMSVAGHTNDSIAIMIGEHVFVGDTLFMPDQGSARCDFPGGSATTLFASVQRLHALADHYTLWMCHDYQPNGRKLAYSISVAKSRQTNIHINESTRQESFVKIRETRDKILPAPRLIYPAIQVNIRAGKLPEPQSNGKRYLQLPIS